MAGEGVCFSQRLTPPGTYEDGSLHLLPTLDLLIFQTTLTLHPSKAQPFNKTKRVKIGRKKPPVCLKAIPMATPFYLSKNLLIENHLIANQLCIWASQICLANEVQTHPKHQEEDGFLIPLPHFLSHSLLITQQLGAWKKSSIQEVPRPGTRPPDSPRLMTWFHSYSVSWDQSPAPPPLAQCGV